MIRVDGVVGRGAFRLEANLASDARVLGIWGRSGSGKTTLLRTIAGLQRMRGGELRIGTATVDGPGVWTPPHRRPVGLVFQDHRLFPHLSARDNLVFGYRRTPEARRRLDPGQVIRLLHLDPFLDRPVRQCSGGEQKRIALGRTLLTSPQLLLLDEPCTGLDPALRAATLSLLRRIAEAFKTHLVVVSHDRSDLVGLAESVAEIADGRVRMLPSPSALLRREFFDAPFENLLRGRVVGGEAPGTVSVDVGGVVPLTAMAPRPIPGGEAVVLLAAQDVVLFRESPPPGSARNRLAATVTGVFASETETMLELEAGFLFRAGITRTAFEELALREGDAVHVLIKARSMHAYPSG